jgi:hypothetical protein
VFLVPEWRRHSPDPRSFPALLFRFFLFVLRIHSRAPCFLFSRGFRRRAGPCQSHVCVGSPNSQFPSPFLFFSSSATSTVAQLVFVSLTPLFRLLRSRRTALMLSLLCFRFSFFVFIQGINARIDSLPFFSLYISVVLLSLLGRLSWFRWPACFT